MKRSLLISVVVGLQLLMQIITQLYIIRVIGVGSDTDAYIAAQTVPAIAYAVVVSALQSTWLPRLSNAAADIGEWKKAQSIAQGQAAIFSWGGLLLMIVTMPHWMPLLFPKFSDIQNSQAVLLGAVFSLAAVFNIKSGLLLAALQARGKFLSAEAVMAAGAIISFGVIWIVLPSGGLVAAALVILGRSVLTYVVQMRMACWPLPNLRIAAAEGTAWRSMRPVFLGASVYKMSPLVDRYWAAKVGSGGITLLNLAQTAIAAVTTLLEKAICAPLAPAIARMACAGDFAGVRNTYRRGLLILVAIAAFMGLSMLLVKGLFVTAVAYLLEMNEQDAQSLWWMCFIMTGYVLGAAGGTVTVSVFYALGNTRLPMRIGVIGFCSSLMLKWFGFTYFSLPGLVIAIVLHYLLNLAIMLVVVERYIPAGNHGFKSDNCA